MMKVIDKSNGNSQEWGYGTVLKCWDSNPTSALDSFRQALVDSGSSAGNTPVNGKMGITTSVNLK